MKWRWEKSSVPEEMGVVEEWESGWRMSPAGSAVASRAGRCLLWGLVMAGPLLGLVAWSSAAQSTPIVPPKSVEKPRSTEDTAGPAGFAELFVTSYLTAKPEQVSRLEAFLPGAAERVAGAKEPVAVDRAAAVKVRQMSSSYWSVTVAVQLDAGLVGSRDQEEREDAEERAEDARFFQVPVSSGRGSGEGLTAVALPSEVGAPATGKGTELGYGRPGPVSKSDAAAGTLRGFFEAFLTGRGDVERFLSPGTGLSAVQAPYAQVRLVELATQGVDAGSDEASEAPVDGERRRVLVEVEASQEAGHWRPMTYAVQLAARDGRWEVARLDGAPLLADGEDGERS